MNIKKLSVLVSAVALLGGLASTSQAQVANGPWSSWSPSYNTQTSGSGSISGTTFSLSSSSSSGEHRAERRYVSFSSGSRQFEGTVRVNSLGGDRICLKQTFQDGTGPWNMIAVKKPGSLYEVQGGATLAGYTIGNSVRINTVSYTGSQKVVVYINGSQVETITGGTLPFYDKLGAYRTNSGNGPVSVTWSGIRFWQK
ncbi:hypothetical protein [Oleiharenicola lentus]|uniref:hypothetical protein n=1 Tax=Oleiharenicola lentus TaxID=2508720 RepID=UPI003F663CC6